MAFDVELARKIAEDFLEDLLPEDQFFMNVGMTIRRACNEIERLDARLVRLQCRVETLADALLGSNVVIGQTWLKRAIKDHFDGV